MDCLDLTLATPEENLALDEALLEAAESGEAGESLRFWESDRPFVVLGAGCRFREEVIVANCRVDAVPVLRRCSGGGTVLQGPGCLNFVLVLDQDSRPEITSIRDANAHILGRVAAALAPAAPGITQRGISDLAVGDFKVSGTAQKRKRRHILFHGTILHAFDLSLVGRYLREPNRRPDYRELRRHDDFIRNLPVNPAAARTAIRAAWGADRETTYYPAHRVTVLIRDKYSRDEHNLAL